MAKYMARLVAGHSARPDQIVGVHLGNAFGLGEVALYSKQEAVRKAMLFGGRIQKVAKQKPRIVVIVEGGNITAVLTEKKTEIVVIDYDEEYVDEKDLVDVPQGDGKSVKGYVYTGEVGEVNPDRVNELVTLFGDHGKG